MVLPNWLRYSIISAGLLVSLFSEREIQAATWQSELEARFDIVDTFDVLQDWSPGAKWYSGSGCATCASNMDLPKKLDGTQSIWGLWNNKGLSFQYTPQNGVFAVGDVIIGATSGATATVRKIWNLDGKWYIQLTNSNAGTGSSSLRTGETIMSGSKSGTNLQWPLFIANHGPAYTWGGSGKSLVLDLGDNSNVDPNNPTMAGLGAQRLGTYFGDGVSGGSGYKKVHVFFMMKISPSFFLACPMGGTGCVQGGYDPVNVVKVFDLMSGFTGVSKWGTAAEAALAGGPNLYRLNEYGLNFSIFNFGGGGLSFPQSLFFSENTYVSASTAAGYDYTQTNSSRRVRNGTGLDIEAHVKAGEWFGVEVAADIGTRGLADGSTDFWIYDKTGREMGHFSVTGESRLMYFDHRYNKFVLGGNRLSVSGRTAGIDSRWWIDDVIIDASRIGTSYFQMLAARGAPDPSPISDTLAPEASIISPAANSSVSGAATVSVHASDNIGVVKTEFYVDGVLRGSDTVAPFSFSWDTTTIINGPHHLSVKAYDAALNVGTSVVVPVTVSNVTADTTAPVITGFTLPATATSTTVPLTLSASDAVGVTGYRVSESSVTPLASANDWVAVKPSSFTFTGTGTRTAYAWAKDAAGNISAVASAQVTITSADASGPTVTGFAMPATANSLTVPVLTFTASDNVGVTGFIITESSTRPSAAAAGWSATPPLTFTFSGSGVRTAFAWAKDAAGNVSFSYRSVQVIVDSTAPVITGFTLPATATSTTVPLTLSASDSVGVTGYRVSESSVTPLASANDWVAVKPSSFTFTGTGTRTAYAWAKDAAGNISAVASAQVTITSADASGPTVTGFAMPATANSLTVPVLTFTASDNVGVTGFIITESSTRPSAAAAGWSATPPLTFTFSGSGVRTAFAWAKDAAGNVSFSYRSVQVIVDSTAPVITYISPTGGTFKLKSPISILGRASDDVAFSHMTLSIDSVQLIQVSSGSLTYSWSPRSRGYHTLSIAAYDKAGNKTVKTVSIYVR